MRTLTVKETAKILGVSVRTIQNRLNSQDLNGKRVTNQYGTSEWRVWPNKEILDKLKDFPPDAFALGGDRPSEEFQGGDSSAVLDAETVEIDTEYFEDEQTPIKSIIREISQQFAEQLSREKQLNFQLQRELEEKELQLKQLPDFQKQAEARRQEAEAKELEAVALAKQIEAMKAIDKEKVADLARLNELETKTLPTIQRQLDDERAQKEKDLAEATAKVLALENANQVADITRKEFEESLQDEIKRLTAEKEGQTRAIELQFESLNKKLEELQNKPVPWWKKILGT